jgi:hypothetical protein
LVTCCSTAAGNILSQLVEALVSLIRDRAASSSWWWLLLAAAAMRRAMVSSPN